MKKLVILLLLAGPVIFAVTQDGAQEGQSLREESQIALEPAEAGDIEAALFLPPQFYVGDPIELRVTIVPKPGVNVSLPEQVPKAPWFNVSDMTLNYSGDRIIFRLHFVSFVPGTRTLPAISLGDITIKEARVHTAVYTTNEPFQELREQVFLPGTWALIGTFAAALLLLPLISISAGRYIINSGRKLLETHRILRPLRRIRQIIRNHRETPSEPKSCYIQISAALRDYLSHRTGYDFTVVTAREFTKALSRYLPEHPGNKELIAFIEFSDRVKFAGATASRRRILNDLDTIDAYVTKTEQIKNMQQQTDQRGGDTTPSQVNSKREKAK